jgi:hypothetical protein
VSLYIGRTETARTTSVYRWSIHAVTCTFKQNDPRKYKHVFWATKHWFSHYLAVAMLRSSSQFKQWVRWTQYEALFPNHYRITCNKYCYGEQKHIIHFTCQKRNRDYFVFPPTAVIESSQNTLVSRNLKLYRFSIQIQYKHLFTQSIHMCWSV